MIYVPPQEIPAIWLHIEPYIQSANNFGGGKFATYHWLAKLLNNAADLFVTPDLKTAVICEPSSFPLRNVYGLILLGGEGEHEYAEYQKVWEDAAKRRGCNSIEIYGRPGWKAILKELGYETAHHVWRKELG